MSLKQSLKHIQHYIQCISCHNLITIILLQWKSSPLCTKKNAIRFNSNDNIWRLNSMHNFAIVLAMCWNFKHVNTQKQHYQATCKIRLAYIKTVIRIENALQWVRNCCPLLDGARQMANWNNFSNTRKSEWQRHWIHWSALLYVQCNQLTHFNC